MNIHDKAEHDPVADMGLPNNYMRWALVAIEEVAGKNGLTIKSCDGDFHLRAAAFGNPEEIGVVDLVICALKATAMDVAERLIRPCVGPQTRILALMNGLGIEEQFGQWFDRQRVLGGLAFVCINRGEPGVIHHMDYGRVAFGLTIWRSSIKNMQSFAAFIISSTCGFPVLLALGVYLLSLVSRILCASSHIKTSIEFSS